MIFGLFRYKIFRYKKYFIFRWLKRQGTYFFEIIFYVELRNTYK